MPNKETGEFSQAWNGAGYDWAQEDEEGLSLSNDSGSEIAVNGNKSLKEGAPIMDEEEKA